MLLTIRDEDLRQRVSQAEPFLRPVIATECEQEQARRDHLALLPSGQRRRIVTQQLLQSEKGAKREDLRHIHSVLAICSLPYERQDIAIRRWERKQGRMSLVVTAGQLLGRDGTWEDQPLPYGSRARLLLLHTCSEAIRQGSPTIQIEDTLSGFMRAMGLQVTGGKKGTLTSFKQQINALAACTMRIGVFDANRAKTITTQPFTAVDVWFPKDSNQRMLWPSTLTFSQDFYQTLSKHALPVNIHAIRAFAGSPRKLDILFWLGYRLHALDKPVPISWEALKDQFGFGYARERRFRSDLAEEIAQIKEVFPKLPVKVTETGFIVSPGSTEVLAIPNIRK